MADATPNPRATRLRLSDLPTGAPTRIDIAPDAEARARIAAEIGIDAVRKLRLSGELRPVGRQDWHLVAMLGATVVQPCVVTLAPVTTRLDEPVERRYLADFVAPEEAEAEMPEDDTSEPLPETLDLVAVLTEALALALPLYPRAEGAALDGAQVTEPGKAPLTDEDLRPFAGLKALKDKLEDKE